MRLIDADELIKGFDLCIDTADDTVSVLIASTFKRIVNKQPTIEPERKKGEWIKKKGMIYCTECSQGFDAINRIDFKFCPNCGADMRGEQDG